MVFKVFFIAALLVASAFASYNLKGTLVGEDGRAVSAQLGFDIQDSLGRPIHATGCLKGTVGCPAGYGATIRLNTYLDALGSTDHKKFTTTWSLVVPSTAAWVYIEAYPKGYGPYSPTNETRYGHSYRRKLSVSLAAYVGVISMKLPLVCKQGGHTGTLTGVSYVNGKPVQYSRVATWSIGPDNNTPNPILGFNVGTTLAGGGWIIPNLPSGQAYQILATPVGGATVHVFTATLPACGTLHININSGVSRLAANDTSIGSHPHMSHIVPYVVVPVVIAAAILLVIAVVLVVRVRRARLAADVSNYRSMDDENKQ